MAFTKAYAKILVGMLPPKQHAALSFICGKNKMAKAHATEEVIDDLIALDLVRRDRTVEDHPRDVVLLTAKGKKVAEFV
jgi:DNA-binding MarR family transcriptional regulator